MHQQFTLRTNPCRKVVFQLFDILQERIRVALQDLIEAESLLSDVCIHLETDCMKNGRFHLFSMTTQNSHLPNLLVLA